MAYGQTTGFIAGAQQADAPRPVTALEAHLAALQSLNSHVYTALDRATSCADRLLGPEPQAIKDPGTLKTSAEPPLVRKMEDAVSEIARMVEALHGQLQRLERI